MTRHSSPVTLKIIKKIHMLLSEVSSGEDIIEFLRSTEPVFMKEVGQFVQVELDRLKNDFDEEFLLYLGSVIGAAYVMGFLIAREVDHVHYDGLIKFDSIIKQSLSSTDIDKIIDENLEKGKKPKEISKIISEYFKTPKKKRIENTKKIKKRKKNNDSLIDLNEGEL